MKGMISGGVKVFIIALTREWNVALIAIPIYSRVSQLCTKKWQNTKINVITVHKYPKIK